MVVSLIEKNGNYFSPSPQQNNKGALAEFNVLLSCSACSLPFRSTPLLLSCDHSFCGECVGAVRSGLKNETLLFCPVCDQESTSVVRNYIYQSAADAQSKLIYGGANIGGEQKQIRELFKRNDDLAKEIAQMNERINPIKKLFVDQGKPILIPLLNIFLLLATIGTFVYGPSAWLSAYAQVARACAWAADATSFIAPPDVITEQTEG